MRRKAKSLICFWLSYVVFLSSAWKNVGMTIACHRRDVKQSLFEIFFPHRKAVSRDLFIYVHICVFSASLSYSWTIIISTHTHKHSWIHTHTYALVQSWNWPQSHPVGTGIVEKAPQSECQPCGDSEGTVHPAPHQCPPMLNPLHHPLLLWHCHSLCLSGQQHIRHFIYLLS